MSADGSTVIQTSHCKVLNKVRVKKVFLDWQIRGRISLWEGELESCLMDSPLILDLADVTGSYHFSVQKRKAVPLRVSVFPQSEALTSCHLGKVISDEETHSKIPDFNPQAKTSVFLETLKFLCPLGPRRALCPDFSSTHIQDSNAEFTERQSCLNTVAPQTLLRFFPEVLGKSLTGICTASAASLSCNRELRWLAPEARGRL